MAWLGERWELRAGDELVGTITIEDQDFPWLSGSFAAEPGFARWAPLFADELALLDRDDPEDISRWEELYEQITGALTLVAPGEPVEDFLLHIDEGRAWFRWIGA
ncbi:hypothetical protein [Actinophytocola sp.]|uniref:hypothetical protein n=1 Tax=Actinophytocola sp. TaxID=1872138 RepID=UPI002ED63689